MPEGPTLREFEKVAAEVAEHRDTIAEAIRDRDIRRVEVDQGISGLQASIDELRADVKQLLEEQKIRDDLKRVLKWIGYIAVTVSATIVTVGGWMEEIRLVLKAWWSSSK